MKYAILCYHDEAVTCAWSKEHDDAVMEKLAGVHGRIAASGKLGPVARLLPTSAATTVRGDREPTLVLDGPFAETKEQLLGFYVVECDDLEEAIAFARELGDRGDRGGTLHRVDLRWRRERHQRPARDRRARARRRSAGQPRARWPRGTSAAALG